MGIILMIGKVKVIKNYKLERKIGEGTFGKVFEGVDMNTGKVVCVKLMKNVAGNKRTLH